MITVKKTFKWLIPTVALLLFALVFSTLPVYAAEEGAGGDDETGRETQASVTFTAGELKLLSVPTLDFGSHAISDEEQAHPAQSVGPDVQVSDLRGSGKGWDLMLSLSPFHLEAGGGPTLKAATIHITGPSVSAVNGNVGTPPAAVAEVTLTSDSVETPVLQAATGTGMGVWNLAWNAATTQLLVKPGTAQQGKSVATLTWSLQSTP